MFDLTTTYLSFGSYLLRGARLAVDDAHYERVSPHEARRAVALALADAGLQGVLIRLLSETLPPSAGVGTDDVRADRWVTAMLSRPGAPLTLLRRRPPRITGDLVLQSLPQVPAPSKAKRDEAIWLEFEVIYDDESAASGVRYRLEGPSAASGRLDRFGYAYYGPVDPGSYRAIFDDGPEEPPVDKGWIDVEAVDSSGRPRAGLAYEVKLSNGQTHKGVLDANGRLLLAGIPEGAHEITFLQLDAASVKKRE